MKTLALALLFPWLTLAQQPQAPPVQAEATAALEMRTVADLPQPTLYAVSFLPLVKGSETVAFVVSPAGKIGTIPMHDIAQAYKTGYRPFTVADPLAITNAVADEEKSMQRRVKELSEDYDALAARYNRLAAISSSAQVQPQPAVDERQMRAALFQSLLQRTFSQHPTRRRQDIGWRDQGSNAV